MTSPCYRCHERRLRCHAECEAYREWKQELDDARAVSVPTTEAHEKKIRNVLRRSVKDRADGRKNHTGD